MGCTSTKNIQNHTDNIQNYTDNIQPAIVNITEPDGDTKDGDTEDTNDTDDTEDSEDTDDTDDNKKDIYHSKDDENIDNKNDDCQPLEIGPVRTEFLIINQEFINSLERELIYKIYVRMYGIYLLPGRYDLIKCTYKPEKYFLNEFSNGNNYCVLILLRKIYKYTNFYDIKNHLLVLCPNNYSYNKCLKKINILSKIKGNNYFNVYSDNNSNINFYAVEFKNIIFKIDKKTDYYFADFINIKESNDSD